MEIAHFPFFFKVFDVEEQKKTNRSLLYGYESLRVFFMLEREREREREDTRHLTAEDRKYKRVDAKNTTREDGHER